MELPSVEVKVLMAVPWVPGESQTASDGSTERFNNFLIDSNASGVDCTKRHSVVLSCEWMLMEVLLGVGSDRPIWGSEVNKL